MDARIFDHAFNGFGGRVDHLLRIIAAFALVIGFACETQAAQITLKPPAGITKGADGYKHQAPGTGTATGVNYADSRFDAPNTGEFFGRKVEVPAQWHLAENAVSLAMLAVKSTPSALVIGATATWLASLGLEWVAGQWKKRIPDTAPIPGKYWKTPATGGACQAEGSNCSFDTAKNAAFSALGVRGRGGCYVDSPTIVKCGTEKLYNGEWWDWGKVEIHSYGTATSPTAPATQADWDAAEAAAKAAAPSPSKALPDAVANELKDKGVALPLKPPVVGMVPQGIYLGDPYVDPTTGKLVRDKANVRPNADGQSANVEVTKEEVNPDGTPKKNEDGSKKPEIEVKDMCEKNPDASACKQFDDPEDTPLENRPINLSVIPLPGFGPDSSSCPAPVSLGNKGGSAVQWEWTKFCDFSLGIRPLVIGFAWIAAAMIVVGVSRKQGA